MITEKIFKTVFFTVLLSSLFYGCAAEEAGRIKPGIEVFAENPPDMLSGKKAGIITNHTALNSKMQSSADIICKIPGVEVAALFSPEHGIRGGEIGFIGDRQDKKGLKIFSLHGETKSPTAEMLKNIDILIFDMQDIGVRSYTFISTMKNSMQAAAKNNIAFIVLDRPNPLGGKLIDGPVLDMKFSSFIGAGPVAYIHGMTAGELALFFNKELGINCDLTVIPMEGWKRDMRWQDTKLAWTPTSPHIPEADTPLFYAATSMLGELPFISVGVGYTLPFKIVGAPWIDSDDINGRLNGKQLPGVYFQPFHFTPFYSHYKEQFCKGFKIIITDEKAFRPVAAGYHIIETLIDMYPENFNLETLPKYNESMFNQSNGTDRILKMLKAKTAAQEIIESYKAGLADFAEKRKKYLLYD